MDNRSILVQYFVQKTKVDNFFCIGLDFGQNIRLKLRGCHAYIKKLRYDTIILVTI